MIGWKKRQSEDLKARGQDEAANGRRSKEEVNLEAARKMAAARVEETTQRMLQDQEDRATKARAAELAEKAAKEAREKEQKRAEVYAINAVMRYVCLLGLIVNKLVTYKKVALSKVLASRLMLSSKLVSIST